MLCKCNEKFLLDLWTCEHIDSRAEVFKRIEKELKRKRLWHYETKSVVDKYKSD